MSTLKYYNYGGAEANSAAFHYSQTVRIAGSLPSLPSLSSVNCSLDQQDYR